MRRAKTPEILFSWRFRPNPDVCKCVFRFCAKFQVSVCKCMLFFDDFCLRSRKFVRIWRGKKTASFLVARGLVFFFEGGGEEVVKKNLVKKKEFEIVQKKEVRKTASFLDAGLAFFFLFEGGEKAVKKKTWSKKKRV